MDVNESEKARQQPSNVVESTEGTSRKSKSSWGLATAVHGVGFVAKKVISNRVTDSIWHSKKSGSSGSNQSDESLSCVFNPKLEDRSRETVDEHPCKSSVNVVDEETSNSPMSSKRVDEKETSSDFEDESVIDRSENSKSPNGGSSATSQLENIEPTNESHVRQVNQHRWPSTSGSTVWPSTTGSNDPSGSLKLRDSSHATHARLVNQHRRPSALSSNIVDENSKPRDGSHGTLVHHHRWPGTVGSNVLNKKNDHTDEVSKIPTFTRTLLHNYTSKPLQESSSDATNMLSSSTSHVDNKMLKIDKSAESQPSSPNKSYSFASRGASPSRTRAITPTPRGVSVGPSTGVKPSPNVRGSNIIPTTRGVSVAPSSKSVKPTFATKWVDPPPSAKEVGLSVSCREADGSLVTRDISPSPSPREVSPSPAVTGSIPTPPAKGASPTLSPIPMTRSISPPDIDTLISSSSPRQSNNINTVSISTVSVPSPHKEICLSPERMVSPTPTREISNFLATREVNPTPTRRVSPTPSTEISHSITTGGVSPTSARGVGHHARDVIPTPVKPSARRHFFNSHIFSIFSRMTDNKKEKNVSNHKDDAEYLELLYNIQVQWQFANVSAEAALDLQRATAERSLHDVWTTILELRDSIAAKKIEIRLLILQLKLYAILYRQMAYMDEWALIQSEYESALSVTTNDLQARSISVPITDGVKADTRDLKLVLFSIGQVLQATVSCVHSTESKLDRTHILAAEVANVALHERALLDECEIFLASVSPLQIEECSLRSYLMQSNRISMSE